jgi:hypothetical protein
MSQRPEHDDRDDNIPANTPNERMKEESDREDEQPSGQSQGTPMKGTDTLATTDLKTIDREKGKRTTM